MMAKKMTAVPLLAPSLLKGRMQFASGITASIARARLAQADWADLSIVRRVRVLGKTRHGIAAHARELAASVPNIWPSSLNRNLADTLVAEVLPLADACRFLEREAPKILRPARLGRHGRPAWLHGVDAEVERVPFGVVLIIAPSNYPLLLPGVQALQALVAGNAVLWKPAAGGEKAAHALMRILHDAGLHQDLLQVLDSSPSAGLEAIREGVDKVLLTGHAETGRTVMHELANTLTPSVMELSGCDAVFLLPSADLERAASALAFGMRLNGSATCMAPRRIFGDAALLDRLLACLLPKLNEIDAIPLQPGMRALLDSLVEDALRGGALIARDGRQADAVTPTIVINTSAHARIMQTDIFAPVMSFCAAADAGTALEASRQCPYALSAAVFGREKEASEFAKQLGAGMILINDIIVSSADPRVAFGGRGASGFGVTRGREGLLEMTAVKTILRQRSGSLRPYARTGNQHQGLFSGLIQALHGGSLRAKYRGLRQLVASAREIERK